MSSEKHPRVLHLVGHAGAPQRRPQGCLIAGDDGLPELRLQARYQRQGRQVGTPDQERVSRRPVAGKRVRVDLLQRHFDDAAVFVGAAGADAQPGDVQDIEALFTQEMPLMLVQRIVVGRGDRDAARA